MCLFDFASFASSALLALRIALFAAQPKGAASVFEVPALLFCGLFP